MMLPIENDLFKIRNDDGINYSYCHQFWKRGCNRDAYTGEWSQWSPLNLFDNRDYALEIVGDNAEGWFLLFQVSGRFCVFDLRNWEDNS